MSDHEHDAGDVPADPVPIGEEPRADGEEQPETPQEGEPALPPKRFRAATDEELDPQRYMVSDDRRFAKARLSGGSIGTESGDAHFLGEVIQRFATALREAAARYQEGVASLASPLLHRLEFGQSVTLEFQISESEDIRAGLDDVSHSPTLDAARSLQELLASEPPELIPRAVRLGPNVTGAYRSFLNALAKDSVTFELQVADVPETVIITSDHARRDAAILSREGQRVSERVVVPGTLTMADSELTQFKLTLPADVERSPLLKGKHRVGGTYPEDIGLKLKEQNLWNSDVTATIEVTYDVADTTATPRPPTYVLVEAEPLVPPPRLF